MRAALLPHAAPQHCLHTTSPPQVTAGAPCPRESRVHAPSQHAVRQGAADQKDVYADEEAQDEQAEPHGCVEQQGQKQEPIGWKPVGPKSSTDSLSTAGTHMGQSDPQLPALALPRNCPASPALRDLPAPLNEIPPRGPPGHSLHPHRSPRGTPRPSPRTSRGIPLPPVDPRGLPPGTPQLLARASYGTPRPPPRERAAHPRGTRRGPRASLRPPRLSPVRVEEPLGARGRRRLHPRRTRCLRSARHPPPSSPAAARLARAGQPGRCGAFPACTAPPPLSPRALYGRRGGEGGWRGRYSRRKPCPPSPTGGRRYGYRCQLVAGLQLPARPAAEDRFREDCGSQRAPRRDYTSQRAWRGGTSFPSVPRGRAPQQHGGAGAVGEGPAAVGRRALVPGAVRGRRSPPSPPSATASPSTSPLRRGPRAGGGAGRRDGGAGAAVGPGGRGPAGRPARAARRRARPAVAAGRLPPRRLQLHRRRGGEDGARAGLRGDRGQVPARPGPQHPPEPVSPLPDGAGSLLPLSRSPSVLLFREGSGPFLPAAPREGSTSLPGRIAPLPPSPPPQPPPVPGSPNRAPHPGGVPAVLREGQIHPLTPLPAHTAGLQSAFAMRTHCCCTDTFLSSRTVFAELPPRQRPQAVLQHRVTLSQEHDFAFTFELRNVLAILCFQLVKALPFSLLTAPSIVVSPAGLLSVCSVPSSSS